MFTAELWTLWTQDTSDPGHFGTSLVDPNRPDRWALVPKCPKDSSDLSSELFCPKYRTRVTTLPGKSWKVMEFSKTILQAWKVMENSQGHGKSWKMMMSWNFFVKMH